MRVFVRDKSMRRRGVLVNADLADFMCIPAVDSVEVWSLTLQGTLLEGQTGRRVPHPMVEVLSEPGSGIIVVVDGEVIFSGVMETADRVESSDADGDWTFTGVSDDVVLEDALAWPTPSAATPEAAEDSNDVRTGHGSDLIRAYVRANIGEGAPSARRSLLAQKLVTTSVPSGLGSVITKSPRYQNLLELCQEIAYQSGVHFRVLDQGGQLVLSVFEGRDRHRAIYWTVKDGFLDSASTSLAAPGVTRPLVAGQGQGEERTIVAPTTTDSVASESLWGRRREVFIDQRQTDDLSELTSKGLEALELPAAGFEVHPSVLTGEGFGSSWRLGDVVTVNADRPYVLPVVAAPVRVTGDGVTVSAVLGRMTDEVSRSLSSRVSSLERNDTSVVSVEAPLYPTLLNGWANYSATTNGYAHAQFYRDASGIVHIEGFLTKTGTGLDPIFQLPVGFRPRQRQEFVGTTGGTGIFRFGVEVDGRVIPRDLPSSWCGIAASFRAWQ